MTLGAQELTDIASANEVVEVINPPGNGDFLIVCEHASKFIPPELGNLGLNGDILQSHIAWDPGALAIARALSTTLDAPLIAHRVSRLVYDCNRPLKAASAVPAKSEIFDIPGNANLSETAREARFNQFYVPFRDILNNHIGQKIELGRAPVIITIHSFTPIFEGVRREVEIGVLHDTDTRFADEFLSVTEPNSAFTVCRNAPYGPKDGVTHTLTEYAIPRGLLNVMFEIKNDLIGDNASQQAIADWLSRHIVAAHEALKEAANDKTHARSAS